MPRNYYDYLIFSLLNNQIFYEIILNILSHFAYVKILKYSNAIITAKPQYEATLVF